jgi:hypothetical protein
MKLPGCSFFDDFVALCHVVPLTGSNLFTYNSGRNIINEIKPNLP